MARTSYPPTVDANRASTPTPPPILRDYFTGTPATDLDITLVGLPWQEAFTFGAGVDAITGSSMSKALADFIPTERATKSSLSRYRYIESEKKLSEEIDVSASATYNIVELGTQASASLSYLSTLEVSELSITLLADYQSLSDDYDEADTYTLKPEALALLQDHPDQFRSNYGDYFIAGSRRGSRFIASYACKATSIADMQQFKASLAAEAPEVFKAEGSTAFKRVASEHHINVSATVYMMGITGTPPKATTIEETLKAYDWFTEHERGTNLYAKLLHYSYVVPTYPHTIPNVPPSVFTELAQLYRRVWHLRSLYATCPPRYQKQVESPFMEISRSVVANKGTLVTDSTVRQQFVDKAANLEVMLAAILTRMDTYFAAKKAQQNEPGQGSKIEEGTGVQSWAYGITSSPDPTAVTLTGIDLPYSEKYSFGDTYKNHTIEWRSDGKQIIVGWQVISTWTDGTNGSWWKETAQVLLTDHAAIHIRSNFARGYDWRVRLFVVDALAYQFADQ